VRLQEELTKRGLSQRELAYRSGVSVPLVNGYCRGARPCRRNAERIAKTLGMEPEALWGRELETYLRNR
jgi:transcriptional regulator with XRE-family HTH domain